MAWLVALGPELVGTDVASTCRLERSVESRDRLRVPIVACLGRGHDDGRMHGDTAVLEFLDDELGVPDSEAGKRHAATTVNVDDAAEGRLVRQHGAGISSLASSYASCPYLASRAIAQSGKPRGRVSHHVSP